MPRAGSQPAVRGRQRIVGPLPQLAYGVLAAGGFAIGARFRHRDAVQVVVHGVRVNFVLKFAS